MRTWIYIAAGLALGLICAGGAAILLADQPLEDSGPFESGVSWPLTATGDLAMGGNEIRNAALACEGNTWELGAGRITGTMTATGQVISGGTWRGGALAEGTSGGIAGPLRVDGVLTPVGGIQGAAYREGTTLGLTGAAVMESTVTAGGILAACSGSCPSWTLIDGAGDIGAEDDLSVNDDLYLADDGDFRGQWQGGDGTYSWTACSSAGSLCTEGQLEVDGAARFDGTVTAMSITDNGTTTQGNASISFGPNYYYGGTVYGGVDGLLWGMGVSGGPNVIFTTNPNRVLSSSYHGLAGTAGSTPRVAVFGDDSVANDHRDYMYISHNDTNAEIVYGTGGLAVSGAALQSFALMTWTANPTTDAGVVFTVGNITLTGKTSGATGAQFNFGANITATIASLVTAYNAQAGRNCTAKVGLVPSTTVTFYANTAGVAGDLLVTTETTDTDSKYSFPGAVLSGGRDASSGTVIYGNHINIPTGITADPCKGAGYAEGSIFWNATSHYLCVCDGTNDIKVADDAACF